MSIRHPHASAARSVRVLFLLVPALSLPEASFSQEAIVQVEENFRAEPDGTALARLTPGTRVTVQEQDGDWSRVTIEGFVWMPSLQIRDAGEFDLVISQPEGENLREEPAGRIAGRLAAGTLLEELERMTGWIRVRRTGWLWTPSLAMSPGSRASEAAPPAGVSPGPSGAPEPVGSASSDGWLRAGAQRAPLLAAPDGDTLGMAQPGAELRLLAREGNWARVQLDGWVWVPGLEADVAGGPEDPSVLPGVRPHDLSSDFERYRGRLVEMELQFISLQRAEQIRTDFYEGEPYLLTRSLDPDRSFVYVAVAPERMAELGTLTPLETVVVLGRVRAGAAAFTGSPILDLMELERVR